MTRTWLLVTLFACGGSTAAPVAAVPRACELRTDLWLDQPSILKLANGTPFVDVIEVVEANVSLAARAHVTFRTKTLALRGFVDGLHVYAAAPFLVDYVVPGPTVPLRFRGARDRVAFELDVPFTKATLRGEQPCSALGVDGRGEFALRDAIAAPTKREAYVHAGRDIPLGNVTLRFAESPRADVLEERGDRARVAIRSSSLNPAEDVLFVGWIPASALHADARGTGGSWGMLAGARMPPRERPLAGARAVRCPREVPLAIDVGGEHHTVGAIAPGAVIEIVDDGVRIRDSGVQLASGVRWLVAPAALAACETIRP